MEILFPLIRALKIDSREIFHPEIRLDNPAVSKLHLLIEQCSEDEAAALIPIIESILSALSDRPSIPPRPFIIFRRLFLSSTGSCEQKRISLLFSYVLQFTLDLKTSLYYNEGA